MARPAPVHTRVRPNQDGTWGLWYYQPHIPNQKWDWICLEHASEYHAKTAQTSWHKIWRTTLCSPQYA